jgi:hypothetical protein
MVVSRQFVTEIITCLQQAGKSIETVKSVVVCLLDVLHTRAIAYEEQITQLRQF